MIYRHESWGCGFFFFLLYRDSGDTERVFEHDIQPHAKIHITLNMDIEKKREKKACGGVS